MMQLLFTAYLLLTFILKHRPYPQLNPKQSPVLYLSAIVKETMTLVTMMINISNSKIHCTVHEDNTGTLEIAKEYRIRPRTKHINVKYWHFNQFMKNHKGIMMISGSTSRTNWLTC